MKPRLLIDTDVALGVWHEGRPRDVDDGFVLVAAINSAQVELVGITSVYGNGPLLETDRVARELVALKDAQIPVHRGAEVALPRQGELPAPNAAAEFLAAALAEAPAHVAAIGPLTNLGLLAHHFPEAIPRIQSLTIVGGRTLGQRFELGGRAVSDFNVENDMRAVELLLETGIPLVLAGFELTRQVVLTPADLERLLRHGTSTAHHLFTESQPWISHWMQQFPGDAGFHPWDSAALSWLEHPEYFLAEARGARIRAVGDKEWLETEPTLPGTRHTFLTGFSAQSTARFVADIVDRCF